MLSIQKGRGTVFLVCSTQEKKPIPQLLWQRKNQTGQFLPVTNGSQWSLGDSTVTLELSETHYGLFRCVARVAQVETFEEYTISEYANLLRISILFKIE